MNGILIKNKPEGKTSFDVIRDVRIKYQTKKVGHIGTLDPLAQGVLPILIGDATKLSEILMEHDKEYVAILSLGKKTSTGDREGEVIEEDYDIEKREISKEEISSALNKFLGETDQVPPMYSALKVNGKKLYELARKGLEVERKPRKINITEIELLEYDKENLEIKYRVVCSKGTYIRVLCEDIANALGTCGFMKSLVRTRVGNFKLEDEDLFLDIEDIDKVLDVNKVTIKDIKHYENGLAVDIEKDANTNIDINTELAKVYFENKFIGLGKIKDNKVKRFIYC